MRLPMRQPRLRLHRPPSRLSGTPGPRLARALRAKKADTQKGLQALSLAPPKLPIAKTRPPCLSRRKTKYKRRSAPVPAYFTFFFSDPPALGRYMCSDDSHSNGPWCFGVHVGASGAWGAGGVCVCVRVSYVGARRNRRVSKTAVSCATAVSTARKKRFLRCGGLL